MVTISFLPVCIIIVVNLIGEKGTFVIRQDLEQVIGQKLQIYRTSWIFMNMVEIAWHFRPEDDCSRTFWDDTLVLGIFATHLPRRIGPVRLVLSPKLIFRGHSSISSLFCLPSPCFSFFVDPSGSISITNIQLHFWSKSCLICSCNLGQKFNKILAKLEQHYSWHSFFKPFSTLPFLYSKFVLIVAN